MRENDEKLVEINDEETSRMEKHYDDVAVRKMLWKYGKERRREQGRREQHDNRVQRFVVDKVFRVAQSCEVLC